jgi:hypothetical protein
MIGGKKAQRTGGVGALVIMIAALVLAGLSCSNASDPAVDNGHQVPASSAACVECHSDEARLRAHAEPDTSEGGEEPSGEG